MRIEKGIVHTIAGCETCGKEWQSKESARRLAYNHAKKYRHDVWVEIGISIRYEND